MPNILIVDDSGFTRKMIVKCLTINGYKDLKEAASGEEALKKIEAQKPDLVLLDIILTGQDGIEVLKKIKKKNPEIKVIMVTAIGQESYVKDAKKYRADGYVIKPFTPDQICNEVKKLI